MSKDKPIPRELKSRQNARILRKNPTKEENHLWYDFLRNYPVRFHRQYVIESYIVDFFCPKARLVIELDGNQHYEKESYIKYDSERTKCIEKYGILVIRYSNLDIHHRFRNVCADIDRNIQYRLKVISEGGQPSAPSGHLP